MLQIKKIDGEPLWRADVLFDMLTFMFSNTEYRFTPPSYTQSGQALFPTDRTWSFAEVYLDCMANSPRAHKALKEKMAESQEFAVNFAKNGLLINIGRLNTTHALSHESKQVMRSYHPIPSIQMHEVTRKNLVDSARMKAQMKACILPREAKEGLADSLHKIAAAGKEGKFPTTTVANALFVIMAEAQWVAKHYLPESAPFTDLINSKVISSQDKARALIWIVHRLVETDISQDLVPPHNQIPRLSFTPADTSNENIDPPEEVKWGQDMQALRADYIEKRKVELAVEAASAAGSTTRGQSRKDTPSIMGDMTVEYDGLNGQQVGPTSRTALEPLLSFEPTQAEVEWDVEIPNYVDGSSTTLQHSFKRFKREREQNIDPLYDSDSERCPHTLALPELRARVNVFLFRSNSASQKDIVRYTSAAEAA